MNPKVRVRFAPSPTGPLHIGGVRTALFNYLFAKKNNGTFVLRIEDTDQNRFIEGAEEYIEEALNWCGIPYDEGPEKDGGFGPYKQSERKHLYRQYADELITKGKAYFAFDSAEELGLYRKEAEAKGETFIYNWQNREKLNNTFSLTKEEVDKRISNGDDYVIRFKMLDIKNEGSNGAISTTDIIRGHVSFKKDVLDDKVLFKSDGMPTYHLANIVDDHLMEITHVIRGEEWLPSLPLHISLYQAFDWNIPEFAHLPLILKPTGKGKLSKRDGDKLGFPVFPLAWKDDATNEITRGFREDGYFSDALINFLAFLGWNPGTEQEMFGLGELINTFSLDRVHKAGARFDPDKIKWFNHQYMQLQNNEDLAKLFMLVYPEIKDIDIYYISMVVSLIKERATFVDDFWDLSHFFFETPTDLDEKSVKKAWKEDASELMSELVNVIHTIEDYSLESVQTIIKAWITTKEVGFGKVMMPLRLALVGSLKGPDVFQIMCLIGKDESIRRIENVINTL